MSTSANHSPTVIVSCQELRAALDRVRQSGKTIGLVPTMGALHAGHLSLVEASCRECDCTVATIFVNPTQFGPGEDWERYPRTLQADLDRLAQFRVDFVFAPAPGEMYPPEHATFVEVGEITTVLEGAVRPGHFRGVATIVLKLFNLSLPHVAYFGQKDYQQTLVVRRMIADLNLPIELRVCATMRESDGLAMSSRNVYLSASERRQALVLSRSLQAGAEAIQARIRRAAEVIGRMERIIASEPAVQLDYLTVADRDTLKGLELIDGPVVLLVAARVGKTRLIDNRLA